MSDHNNDQTQDSGSIPVRVVSGGGGGTTPVTPAAGVAAITTGGTAVTAMTGPVGGGYITNPSNAAAQGVALENLYIDMVAAPGSTDTAANGTTSILQPGQTFTIPALALGVLVRVNAATSGHKFTSVKW